MQEGVDTKEKEQLALALEDVEKILEHWRKRVIPAWNLIGKENMPGCMMRRTCARNCLICLQQLR